MARCTALYSSKTRHPAPRTQVELARDVLYLTYPDGRWQRVNLHGCQFQTQDATCNQRFVRHLVLSHPHRRIDLITPPDQGTIAPRAAGLPAAPGDAAIVERPAWDALADWLASGGRLAGRTIAELARLSCVASAQFAVVIGELAAQVAGHLAWERCGPMRDSGGVHDTLGPFEEAARTSPRAADALMAAMAVRASAGSSKRRRPRSR